MKKQQTKAAPLSIRITVEEKVRLEESAAKADLSLSKYVRQILLGDADELDVLIAKRGRQRHLPDLETTTKLAQANIKLDLIAKDLANAKRDGSAITLAHLIFQLEEIRDTLTKIRRARL